MPFFGRAKNAAAVEDSVARLRNDQANRSRATSLDGPQVSSTSNPRRWSEKTLASVGGSTSTHGAHSALRPLAFDRGTSSKPPTTGPSGTRSRSGSAASESLLARGKNLFRRSSNASKTSIDIPSPIDQQLNKPITPTYDIRRVDAPQVNPKVDESDRELSRLRDAAARSIGMTPPVAAYDDYTSKSMRTQGGREIMNNNTSHSRSTPRAASDVYATTRTANGSIPAAGASAAVSGGGGGTFPPTRPARAMSRNDAQLPPPPNLPFFPSSRRILASSIQLESPVSVHKASSGSGLWSKTSRNWKSRHLVLTVHTQQSGDRIVRTNMLHLFKGTSVYEDELERLHITAMSSVTLAGPGAPEVGDRPYVLQVTGFANGSVLDQNFMITSGQDASWLFQAPDDRWMRAWFSTLKNEVQAQRTAVNSITTFISDPQAPSRMNSIRRTKLTINSPTRPDESVTPTTQERQVSPVKTPSRYAHENSTSPTRNAHNRSASSNDVFTADPNTRVPASSRYPAALSIPGKQPNNTTTPSPTVDRGNPFSPSRMMSLGASGIDDHRSRDNVSRFLSGHPDPSTLSRSATNGRASPTRRAESPSLPPPPRARRGTTSASPTKTSFFNSTTPGEGDIQSNLTKAVKAMNLPNDLYPSYTEELKRRPGESSTNSRRPSVSAAYEREPVYADDHHSRRPSRTRSSSASSSRDPQHHVGRSNSSTRRREQLPPIQPPPRGRPPEPPVTPSTGSTRHGQLVSSPTSSIAPHGRSSRKPSMRPSTTFGPADRETPASSTRGPHGVESSSRSMQSQLSNGTSKTQYTTYNYEPASAGGYDASGRSSRAGSVSATGVMMGGHPSSADPQSLWATPSPYSQHPYAGTPTRPSFETGGSANSSSMRASHEDDRDRKAQQRSSTLPPPRPAPSGALPPTPDSGSGSSSRPQKKRHASSGSSGTAAYPTYAFSGEFDVHVVDRSRPPVSGGGPSSYRTSSRRVSAPTASYKPATPSSGEYGLSSSGEKHTRALPPSPSTQATSDAESFVMPAPGGGVSRRSSNKSKSHSLSPPNHHHHTSRGGTNGISPFNSFLNIDTPGTTPNSSMAKLPTNVPPPPLPQSMPIRLLPTPDKYQNMSNVSSQQIRPLPTVSRASRY